MKNVCKRNCTWNHDGQCCPECNEHYEDGTAHTKNCSEYLNEHVMNTFIENTVICEMVLRAMNEKEVRRLKHEMHNIVKDNEFATQWLNFKPNNCNEWRG